MLDPVAFGPLEDFLRESDYLLARVMGSRPDPDSAAVRVPGQQGWRRRQAQLARGGELYPGILEALRSLREARELVVPEPLEPAENRDDPLE